MTADRLVLRQFEVASPFALLTSSLDRPGKTLRLLVRYRGHPVGWVNVPTEGSATIDESRIRHLITEQIGWDLAGFAFPAPDAPLEAPAVAGPISVVVCTRDRPQDLERCLRALLALDYPDFEVLVVDNASQNDETAAVAARLGVRSVREDRPGLDWARNRGIAETRHSIIAFVDDDARPDSLWLAAIASAFVDPEVDAVTGLVAPLELETSAQRLFEFTYGGMGKGFAPRTFHRDRNSRRRVDRHPGSRSRNQHGIPAGGVRTRRIVRHRARRGHAVPRRRRSGHVSQGRRVRSDPSLPACSARLAPASSWDG